MGKYFIDTEFIEGFHKPLFGKRRHFIDLISIGIVAEDGREYYAISNEFKEKDADQWVKDNVISKLPAQFVNYTDPGISPNWKQKTLLWKSNKRIAQDIIDFTTVKKLRKGGLDKPELNRWEYDVPEFYGYYADYDWVLFCSLFGRMIDLPTGFPMYCRDLKQMLDDKAENLLMEVEMAHPGETRFETSLRQLKNQSGYPKQSNEHNALADAKWNMELYKFITNCSHHSTKETGGPAACERLNVNI